MVDGRVEAGLMEQKGHGNRKDGRREPLGGGGVAPIGAGAFSTILYNTAVLPKANGRLPRAFMWLLR
ncbi:uncharacterized protein BCN122_I0260 [Burkholderia cenocepacia]|nr:uncharacterized protein BCN122_I0260 [Burkholderia cenocepacia]EPZ86380.1 hypothetical protein BURCENK562V_C6566 [Burkholderia cenocepacia K56-2Valvano]